MFKTEKKIGINIFGRFWSRVKSWVMAPFILTRRRGIRRRFFEIRIEIR
jgi:hypothetical protein